MPFLQHDPLGYLSSTLTKPRYQRHSYSARWHAVLLEASLPVRVHGVVCDALAVCSQWRKAVQGLGRPCTVHRATAHARLHNHHRGYRFPNSPTAQLEDHALYTEQQLMPDSTTTMMLVEIPSFPGTITNSHLWLKTHAAAHAALHQCGSLGSVTSP